MATTPNIGDVNAAVQRSTQIGLTGPGGSGTTRQPLNLAPQKTTTWHGVTVPQGVANQPQYNLNFNMPYAAFTKKYLTPDYSPSELLALSSKGYVGAFTSGSKTTLAPVGPAYSTMRALWDLRSGRPVTQNVDATPVNQYGTHGINLAGNVLDVAKQPTSADLSEYATNALSFAKRYGASGEKYVKEFGHLPSESSKYGDLFAANAQDMVDKYVSKFQSSNYSAAQASYQDSLAAQATSIGTNLKAFADKIRAQRPNAAKSFDTMANDLIVGGQAYSVGASKSGKYSSSSIKALQGLLKIAPSDPTVDPNGYLSTTQRWDKTVVDTVNASAGADQTAAATKGLSGDAINYLTAISPAIGGFVQTQLGKQALVATAQLATSKGLLSPSTPDYNNPLSVYGTTLLNAVKSVGRISAGLPMGLYMASDAIAKSVNNIESGKTSGPNNFYGIDTTMLNAMKQDYVRRYKTPFDQGVTNSNSWANFGKIIVADPVAPALDALSVVPVVGWAAKGADIASVFAKTARAGEVIGLEGNAAAEYARANGIIAENAFNPVKWAGPHAPSDVASLKTVSEAQNFVNAINDAKVNISSRTFAGLLRKAHVGDPNAIETLDRYRKLGLVIPSYGKDAPWVLKAAAKFEERTVKMKPPVEAINQEQTMLPFEVTRRLPASPLARGFQEGTMVVTRGLQKMAAKAEVAAEGTKAQRVVDTLVRLPKAPYNWQYSRALKSNTQYFQGDLTTTGEMAHATLKMAEEANLDEAMQRVVLATLSDAHSGDSLGRLGDPAYARTINAENKARIQADMASGALSKDNQTAQADIQAIDTRLGLMPDQATYEQYHSEFMKKLENPTAQAPEHVEAAYKVYTRMKQLQDRVQRLVHGESHPQTVEYLKMVYSEAMQALHLRPDHLFGSDTGWSKAGELWKYRNRVVQANDNLPIHETMFGTHEAHQLMMDANGVDVFSKVEGGLRTQRIQDFADFMQALRQNGVFRDGTGTVEGRGNPVLILAKDSKLSDSFVSVHIPRLDGSISDAGLASRRALVDESRAYTVPREFFGESKLQQAEARNAFEHGSLNAMHDYFPNPQFYSDKLSEASALGELKTFSDVKNEHQIATAGLKAHTLRMHILSQKHYLRNRYERDLFPIAEANSVLVPMSDIGRGKFRDGFILKGVNVFDTPAAAENFAAARGIKLGAREGVISEAGNPGSTLADSPFNVERGFGTIQRNGKTYYVVRSTTTDYAIHALRDTATQLQNKLDYREALYDLGNHPSVENAYALVVPKNIDNVLKQTVAAGNDYASNLLRHNTLAKATSIWKRLVLFGPHFISSNLLGGGAMYMLHNPLMAGKTMLRMLAYAANKAGMRDYANIAAEGEAITNQLAYELRHNVFSEDSGLHTIEDANHAGMLKKYGWNGAYTVVAGFEHMLRTMVAKDFLESDPVFKAFMGGPEVRRYMENGVDFMGRRRTDISPFEAAVDLTMDPASKYFMPHLKTRMRYVTNTVSGNYHSFGPTEQFVRNFLSPFYAWQRHSLAYTWRLPIDKPITANVLNNIGQYGYQQQLADGNLPSFMYQTIPLPQVVEQVFGLKHEDRRIDLSNLNPFGTTADLAAAFTQLVSGQKIGANVFSFTNPIINATIESVLHVNPQTGTAIAPADQQNWLENLKSTVEKTPGITIPKSLTWDAINGAYSDSALSNKYASVDATDILRNYNPAADPSKKWALNIPKQKMTVQAGSYGEQLFNVLFPIKVNAVNVDRMAGIAQKEAVAAGALNNINQVTHHSSVENYINRVSAWKQERDYVQQVWLPNARRQGMSDALIQVVLNKVDSDRPLKGPAGVDFDSTLKTIGG